MPITRGRGSRSAGGRGTGGRGTSGRGPVQHTHQDSGGVQQQSDARNNSHSNEPLASQPPHDVVDTLSSRPDGSSRLPVDTREEIWIERPGMTRFVPSKITKKIMKTLISRMPCFAPTWKEYPSEMKEALYAEFKAKYRFRYAEEEPLGRGVWEATCQDRYSDNMSNVRSQALREFNTTDVEQLRNKPVRGIPVEVWNLFVDYWVSEKFQRRSASSKANRNVLLDAAVHSGGSVSFGLTRERMEKEKGGPVSMRDLYERTHRRKGTGDFVSRHAQDFLEKLDAELEREYGNDPSQYPIVDKDIWMAAAGPTKKGRIEGLERSLTLETGSSITATGPNSLPTETNHPNVQYQELNNKVNMMSDKLDKLFDALVPFISRMATSSGHQDRCDAEDAAASQD